MTPKRLRLILRYALDYRRPTDDQGDPLGQYLFDQGIIFQAAGYGVFRA